MLKEKLKRNKESIKIDSKLLDSIRKHCKPIGMTYTFFLYKAAEEKLERDTTDTTKNH